jgi:hypothetical protein
MRSAFDMLDILVILFIQYSISVNFVERNYINLHIGENKRLDFAPYYSGSIDLYGEWVRLRSVLPHWRLISPWKS